MQIECERSSVNDTQMNNQKKIKKNVLILSIYYFLVTVSFSSFSTVVIYIHQKYKHKGYGQTYLTANMLSSITTYFFCPFIIDKMKQKSKILLVLCTLGYFINMVVPMILSLFDESDGQNAANQMNVAPPSKIRFIIQIIANIVGGCASSIYWVLQGIYLAKYCKLLPQNCKGKYFGLSNAILNSRVVAGPLLTILGLSHGSQTTYFGLLSLVVLISFPFPLFFIPSLNLRQEQDKPLYQNSNQELSQDLEQNNKKQSICKYFLSFLLYFKKVVFLLPFSIIAGLMAGFAASSLSHLLPTPVDGENNDTKVAISLIFFGFGNILGGYISGLFSDKLSLKIAGFIGCIFVIIQSVTEAVCLSLQHTLVRSCLVGFLSGLCYSYLYSYVSIVCTINYKGNSFSFATNKQITSFSYIGYSILVAFLNNKCNMRLNMTYQGLALIPLALISVYCIKKQTDNNIKKVQQYSASDNVNTQQQNK